MPVKDFAFVISYFVCFVSFFIFLVVFTRADWAEYEDGFAGLWIECRVNESLPPEHRVDCHNTAKAEGPTSLELVRTLLILALAAGVLGLAGNTCCPPKDGEPGPVKVVKEKLQEWSYFFAGIFTIAGTVLYGLNYQDYYSEEKGFSNAQLRWGFYLVAVVGGLNCVASITMGFVKIAIERQSKRQKARDATKALNDKRNSAKQSGPKEDETGREKEEENDGDMNDLVTVKSSALKRIVAPTNIMLAFNRIKSGKKRKDSTRRLFTPREKSKRFDDRSSACSSSGDEETNHDETNNDKRQRQKVKRPVTTLIGDTSPKPWAVEFVKEDEFEKRATPRRHMSDDGFNQHRHTTQSDSLPATPDQGIYTIPLDDDNLDMLTPPKYEDVIGSHNYGDVPQPTQTEQSKIFQPYSKN